MYTPNWSRLTEQQRKCFLALMRWMIIEQQVRRIAPVLADVMGGMRVFVMEVYLYEKH